MPYGQFSTYEEVAVRFSIKLREVSFVQEREIKIKPDLFEFIEENLKLRRNFATENAVCETIISPVLTVVSRHYNLPVWSHFRFDISPEEGLAGNPDFIIAPASDIGTMFKKPVICVAEAKREDFNEGWAQALSEMIAAQRYNENENMEIFGIVTTGRFWQFGKLEKNILSLEIISYSALENLQKLLNMINWLFYEAEKNLTVSTTAEQ